MAGALAPPDHVGRMEVAMHAAHIGWPARRSSTAFQAAAMPAARRGSPRGRAHPASTSRPSARPRSASPPRSKGGIGRTPAPAAGRSRPGFCMDVGEQFVPPPVALRDRLAGVPRNAFRAEILEQHEPLVEILGVDLRDVKRRRAQQAVDGHEGGAPSARCGRSRHKRLAVACTGGPSTSRGEFISMRVGRPASVTIS